MKAAYTLGGLAGAEYFSGQEAQDRLVTAIEDAGHTPDDNDLRWIEQGLADGAEQPLWVRTRKPEVPASPLSVQAVGGDWVRPLTMDRHPQQTALDGSRSLRRHRLRCAA